MGDEFAQIIGSGESASDQDSPPPGDEEWKEQTKAIERVIAVSLTLDRPQTADWIADEAAVASQTARDHLSSLSDLGIITKTTARGVTKYQLDAAFKRFRQVSHYVERYEKEKLIDAAGDTKEQIESTKEKYEVEDPDELRGKAADPETDIEDIQIFKKAASEWETLQHRLDVMKEAIERYDEFSRPEVTA